MADGRKFIADRLRGVSPDDLDNKYKQAIVDLVASDIPLDLDPFIRRLIAGELHRLYFPNSVRDRRAKRRNEAAMVEDLKAFLRHGMSAEEAEEEIVKRLGPTLDITNVEALRKRLQLRGIRTKT